LPEINRQQKRRVAVETTVKIEKDKFKRPILVLPPQVHEGVYQLYAFESGKFVVIMLKKEFKKRKR